MSDNLRALTEDPELRALMEKYYAAPASDRDRLLGVFAQKMCASYPDGARTVERSIRNAVFLRAMLDYCEKAFLGKPDLSEFDRAIAMVDAADSKLAIEALHQVDPHTRDVAFELATTVLFIGLRAGLDRDEVEKLRRAMPAELGSKGGKALKKESPGGRTRLTLRKKPTPWLRTRRSPLRSRTGGSLRSRSTQVTGRL